MGLTPLILHRIRSRILSFAGQCFPDIEVIFIVPDKVLGDFDYYLNILKGPTGQTREYEGVKYLIVPKK